MSSPLEIIKENPMLAVGGVVLILILLSMRGGDTSPTAMINAQLQAQKTASQTDVALSGINANAATERAKIVGDVYKTTIVSGVQLATVRDNNATANTLGAMAANNTAMALANQRALGTLQINSATGLASQSIAAQSQALQDANNLRHYQIEMNTQSLPAILQAQVQTAQANGQTAQAIAAIQQGPAQTAANTAAASSSNSSDMAWVSTAATIASYFFSDERLKKDVAQLYVRGDGLGVYVYRYIWEDAATPLHVGVMAQEVENVYPGAVKIMGNGYKAVDYSVICV